VEYFAGLEDPRCVGKIEHLLIDILVIAVCAVIARAERWMDTEIRPGQGRVAGDVSGLAERDSGP